MDADLFVYGTLMLPEVMHAVSGYHGPGEHAILNRYRRRLVAGEVYPAIVEAAGETVDGLVYRGLDGRQLARLDRFEGEMYRRVGVEVLVDAVAVQAQVYVLEPRFRHRLTDRPWSLQDFAESGLRRFREHYRGFDALRGADENSERG
jgi:gamma-glutamylcyclotransferase (GGCT)/AIG2-like uncharacterized protein YtfP